MTRRVTTPILLAVTWLVRGHRRTQAQTQTFKVEKFDIKGTAAPTTSPSKPRPAACSSRAART
jgi:hypothetical protein